MKKFIGILATILTVALTAVLLFACTPVAKLKVINVNLTDEDYAFITNKADTATLVAANALIAEMKADGTVDALVEKYSNGKESDYFTYANPAGGKDMATQLVVVTNAEFAPFEFKSGDKFTGVDIEIAKKLADKMGKTLYVQDGEFDPVVLEVNAGNAHIGMAGLTITEERKEMVTFSDSYFKASQMLIVKDSDTTFDACTTAAEVYTILTGFDSSIKIGYQNATTGEFFVTTTDYLENIKATGKGFKNGALAAKDLQNGGINYVIIDKLPAQKIVENLNRTAK